MANVPKYEITIPSSETSTTFRPFLVKEEKVLLLAQESNSDSDILIAIKNIIESCVDGIEDAGSLPLFDIEYLFLQIRSKSVGESVNPTIICPTTGESISVKVLIPDIEITKNKSHKNKISINDNIILKMKYPTLNDLSKREGVLDYTNSESFYYLIADCIVSIETKSDLIDATSLPKEEVLDFVDSMTKSQFENVLDFFLTSPKIEHTVSYTTSDGTERKVVLSGLSDFFG